MKDKILTTKLMRVLVHGIAWAPGLYLLFRLWTNQLTADPIQDVTQHTGKYALISLMVSLSMTPLKTLTGWSWTAYGRKWFGLYTFVYALIHLFIFIGWDYGFAWQYIFPELFQKAYLIVGSIAFLILLALALTSFNWWIERLGRGWTWLHRLVYFAGGLVVLHYAWVKKGDLFALRGDVVQPFLFGLLFAFLMLLRLPPIRRRINLYRRHRRRKSQSQSQQVVVRRIRRIDPGAQHE